MRLQEGKFYRTRDGRKVGPIYRGEDRGAFFWRSVNNINFVEAWHEDGSYWPVGSPLRNETTAGYDLIAEWTEGPVRTVTRREIIPGQYGAVIVESGGRVRLDRAELTADELRSAAMVFSQLAEVLDDSGN